jgi:hypothetical protein
MLIYKYYTPGTTSSPFSTISTTTNRSIKANPLFFSKKGVPFKVNPLRFLRNLSFSMAKVLMNKQVCLRKVIYPNEN